MVAYIYVVCNVMNGKFHGASIITKSCTHSEIRRNANAHSSHGNKVQANSTRMRIEDEAVRELGTKTGGSQEGLSVLYEESKGNKQ